MEKEPIIKFDNFFGQKVDYSFSNKVIDFSKDEMDKLKEGVELHCWKNDMDISLGEEISSSGGQGIVYKCNIPSIVVKIYNQEYRTVYQERKLQKMVTNIIDNTKICWPQDVLYYNGKFVGFIMNFVEGKNLYSLTTNARRVMQKYPNYSKIEQIELIIEILEQFEYLHQRNILVGDVKLENIMFNDNFNITLIDMDSVQIGEFNCDTSTPGYDPPEIIKYQGEKNIKDKLPDGTYCFNKYYSSFYRTLDNEYFTLAVLIYRIIMNGQFPYNYADWGYVDDNENQYEDVELCANARFAYAEKVSGTNENCRERAIWSYLPSFLKECFVSCFAKGKRYSPQMWLKVFDAYLGLLKQNKISAKESTAVFPTDEISYSKMDFKFDISHTAKGFTMSHTIARLIRQTQSQNLMSHFKEIVQALKQQPEYMVDKYRFIMVYNIGILKKIKVVEDL